MHGRVAVGAMFRCGTRPEALVPFARRVEELGYDELWVGADTVVPVPPHDPDAALRDLERAARPIRPAPR